jgi:hypothetical protein
MFYNSPLRLQYARNSLGPGAGQKRHGAEPRHHRTQSHSLSLLCAGRLSLHLPNHKAAFDFVLEWRLDLPGCCFCSFSKCGSRMIVGRHHAGAMGSGCKSRAAAQL